MSRPRDDLKRQVAVAAAAEARDGMRLGLGSGSTVALVVAALGERVRRGELRLEGVVAASSPTEAALRQAGIAVRAFDDDPELDLAIDGADEVDPSFAMIKGGGGALLRERIVLAAARDRLIIVDESKLVQVLGTTWPVPVEVVRWGWRVAGRALGKLGAEPTPRLRGNQPVVTDEGNYLLDCAFGAISDPERLAKEIAGLPGVVAHGIFVGFADRLLVGTATGVRARSKE